MRSCFKAVFTVTAMTVAALSTGAAHADSVTIISNATIASPGETLSSTLKWAHDPTGPQLVVQVAGKICKLISSQQAKSPNGCSYELNVGADGMIIGALTAGNGSCTQTAQIASSCK